MMTFSFSATLTLHDDTPGSWVYCIVPSEISEIIGKTHRRMFAYKGTINGQPFSGTALPLKPERHIITASKALRAKLGVKAGDTVEIVIEVAL
jgi:hypothetical protein